METKKWYQSRTVGIAAAQAVAGVLAVIYSVDPTVATIGYVAIIKSVIDFFLRAATDKTLI